MKINSELLQKMGFEQQKNNNGILIDKWYMKMHGYLFIIGGGPPNWNYHPPGAYHSHSVSDVEELLAFTFEDGYKSGKEDFKADFREFIGVKKG